MRIPRLAVLAFVLASTAHAEDARVTPITLTAAEKAAAATITPALLRAHVRFLSDDLLEGRGPATRGDRIAQRYIATQMEAIGLEGGAADGRSPSRPRRATTRTAVVRR